MISSFSEHHRRLQRLLVRARHSAGLKQAEVAARLHVPQSFISKYERGERRLDVVELLWISRILNLDPCELLGRIGFNLDDGHSSSILNRWELTAHDLTILVDENPSLRGMLLGYVAEQKLKRIWLSGNEVTYIGKSDDHDRRNKGDHNIQYRGQPFVVESKSLQSKLIVRDEDTWRGKAQVDASDRRNVTLEDGTQLDTTLLMVGEFDVLAVNCFAFEQKWNFVFAKNSDLPRSSYRKYPLKVRRQLLASLVPVSWPPEPPFTDNLFEILDQLIVDKEARGA